MKRDPTKWIVSLGFTAVLTLMLLVTYLSLSQMNENINQMSELIESTYAKYSSTHKMRDLIRHRGEVIDSMYLTDDYFERDLMLLKLSEIALQYKDELKTLVTHDLHPKELRILSTLKPLINEAKIATDLTADTLLSSVSEEEIRRAIIESQRKRKAILTILSELTATQDTIAMNSLNDTMSYHKSSRGLILYLSLATFFIGVLISLLVIRQSSTKNVKIQHQASHDSLTNLPNRNEFEQNLRQVFLEAQQDKTEHALCYMDLDHFKIVNDTCGHNAGDRLLIDLTSIIQKKIRSHDILGRLGGDEFGLILKNCTLSKAMEITQGIITIVKKYEFISDNRVFHVGVSIGIVPINRKTRSYESAMSDADVACYAAKDMGRGRVHVHELDDSQISNMQKELHWVADIQSSIQDNRFKLFAQAILPLDKDDKSSMYEVLLRLKDDESNMVSPGRYIPAAERFGLMHDVDLWVIENTFLYSKRLNAINDDGPVKLFINLSANSLSDKNVCDFIIKKLDELDIEHGSICFEITETAVIKNIAQASQMISTLKAKHVEFALDDFGSGMSSFGYLKNLEVDYLKIDGSFVKNMADNNVDQAMVAAMNKIGNVMKIKTIAEHVENETTLRTLQQLNIDFVQGFYFSDPVPIESLLEEKH